MTDEAAELISIREAARILGVHASTLRNWERADKLEAVRVGSRRDRRFRRGDVVAMAQRRDELVTAKDTKQAGRMVPQNSIWRASIGEMAKALGTTRAGLEEMVARQGSIREPFMADMAKALGTTPPGLNEMLARYGAAIEALSPIREVERALAKALPRWGGELNPAVLQALPTIKESLAQLTAPALQALPTFHELVEPILQEQKLLADRVNQYLESTLKATALPSAVYSQLAASQAELSSSQAIATLVASLRSSSMAQVGSWMSQQISANIGAYQDLRRAALWDLEAMGVTADKRLPFAELKLAGGLLQSATTLVADLPAGAGDARGATVKKPNLFRYFHDEAREVPEPQRLTDVQLEARLKGLRSLRAGNAGLDVVETWVEANRVAQLSGREPVFEPSVGTVAIAARLPLSLAGDEGELGEIVDGLYKLIIEASGGGRRVRAVVGPGKYQVLQEIATLRNYYRHDQAQGAPPDDSRRRFHAVGDVFQRLVGRPVPRSPADWQRACLALMRRAKLLLSAVADRLEGLE